LPECENFSDLQTNFRGVINFTLYHSGVNYAKMAERIYLFFWNGGVVGFVGRKEKGR